jgi:hypothetical protein
LATLTATLSSASVCHAQAAPHAATPGGVIASSPIVELASHESVIYARRADGRLYRWDTATGKSRLLEQEGVVAIAPDGSLAVTHKSVEPRGSRVEVWELASGRMLRARVFENGAEGFAVVNGSVLLVERDAPVPARPEVPMPMPSILPIPIVRTSLWEPHLDRVSKGWQFEGNSRQDCRFSPAGFRLACADERGLSWRDLDRPAWNGSSLLGREWIPRKEPRRDDVPRPPRKPQPEPTTWTMWESLAWTGDGKRVVLAYGRLGEPPECRLERWTPGDEAKAGRTSERLATIRRRCNIKVLAASRDGTRIVTSEYPRLVLRRAPKYEAVEIAPADATLAAFLPGDEQFVTVHRDGMQLWDTQSLRRLATWP